MSHLATTLLLLFTLVLPAAAAPKFATVRISEIYRNLASTRALQKDLEKDRDDIMKDERGVSLQKMVDELKATQAILQAKSNTPADEEVQKMARDYEIKRQEAQLLKKEFEIFGTEKTKDISRKMVQSMRASLNKITETSRKIAGEQGLEGVFDSSGNSNTGVAILLYTKNAKDITNDVIAALKDAGDPTLPAETPPVAAPEPTATRQTPPAQP